MVKDLNLVVWLSQLGISVAVPPAVFILLAVWLHRSYNWGSWVIWVGIVLGVYCAITGFVQSLRALERLTGNKKKERPPVSFNDHD